MKEIIPQNDYLDRLWNVVSEADASFRTYEHFLKMRSTHRRRSVFEKNSILFRHLSNVALYDAILKSAKLMDPKEDKKKGKENLTIDFLSELVPIKDTNLANKLRLKYEILKSLNKNFKKMRNKEIAHLDRNENRDELLRKETVKSLRKIINKQIELIKIYLGICGYKPKNFHLRYYIQEDLKNLFQALFRDLKQQNQKTKNQKKLDQKTIGFEIKAKFRIYEKNEKNIKR